MSKPDLTLTPKESVQERPWTAPQVERQRPSHQSQERIALEEWLDYHRATLLLKCAGLTSDKLKERAVPPSSLSLLGLVRHMTEVERWWFRMHADQQNLEFPYDPLQTGADFNELETADSKGNLEAYLSEIQAAKEAVADKTLEQKVLSRRDTSESLNIRWIYLHMIEEYARHNGHADLLRERIDGQTGY